MSKLMQFVLIYDVDYLHIKKLHKNIYALFKHIYIYIIRTNYIIVFTRCARIRYDIPESKNRTPVH